MEGIPQEVLEQHRNRIIQNFYQAQEDRRIATGNPLPGQGRSPRKKIKYETPEELKARLAEWRARKGERVAGESGAAPPPAAGGAYVRFACSYGFFSMLRVLGLELTCWAAVSSGTGTVSRGPVPSARRTAGLPATRLQRLPDRTAGRAPGASRSASTPAWGRRLLERARGIDSGRAGFGRRDGAGRRRHRPDDPHGRGWGQARGGGAGGEEVQEGEGADVLPGRGGQPGGEDGEASEVCTGAVVIWFLLWKGGSVGVRRKECMAQRRLFLGTGTRPAVGRSGPGKAGVSPRWSESPASWILRVRYEGFSRTGVWRGLFIVMYKYQNLLTGKSCVLQIFLWPRMGMMGASMGFLPRACLYEGSWDGGRAGRDGGGMSARDIGGGRYRRYLRGVEVGCRGWQPGASRGQADSAHAMCASRGLTATTARHIVQPHPSVLTSRPTLTPKDKKKEIISLVQYHDGTPSDHCL